MTIRKRRWFIDGRLKLQKGDIVSIKKKAREDTIKNIPELQGRLTAHTEGEVIDICFDVLAFYITVQILGGNIGYRAKDLLFRRR